MENNRKSINEPSPCGSCTTSKEAGKCQNRNCKRWQAWFAESWNRSAALLRKHLKERDGENGHES